MKKIGLFYLIAVILWSLLFNPILFNPILGCSSDEGNIKNAQLSKDVHLMPEAKSPEHHTENGFRNFSKEKKVKGLGPAFYLRRIWHSIFLHDVPKEHYLPHTKAIQLRNSIPGDGITWLGHATFLIKISGKTILTDPFLTDFASPVSFGGPQRMLSPGIPLDQLPPIDFIIVSHNHYDHLDDKTIQKLQNKDKIQVLVPLGIKPFFTERGYTRVTELNWHNDITINNIKFISVPAVHNSGRSLNDKNKTLWSSWAIFGPDKKVYFGGDSAYSERVYKDIGNKYGPFDYAVVPIGAYEPRLRMKTHHMNPEEAVKAGMDLKATTLIASHWGTINLSDEPPWEPPELFLKAGFDGGFMENNLWIMKIGETRPVLDINR